MILIVEIMAKRKAKAVNATDNPSMYTCYRCTERFFAGKGNKEPSGYCGVCEPRFPQIDWSAVPPRLKGIDVVETDEPRT